jgi:hypothetical protein
MHLQSFVPLVRIVSSRFSQARFLESIVDLDLALPSCRQPLRAPFLPSFFPSFLPSFPFFSSSISSQLPLICMTPSYPNLACKMSGTSRFPRRKHFGKHRFSFNRQPPLISPIMSPITIQAQLTVKEGSEQAVTFVPPLPPLAASPPLIDDSLLLAQTVLVSSKPLLPTRPTRVPSSGE